MEPLQTLDYLKKVTHLYVVGDQYIWCTETKKTERLFKYATRTKAGLTDEHKRCAGCQMRAGR